MATSSSTAPAEAIPAFPPLAALFLTYFDDLKGQTVAYHSSLPDLPAGRIEFTTLPSGLHTLKSDLVFFAHGPEDLPGVGLFRSVEVQDTSRGRRMGTLGIVLAEGAVEDLFDLRQPLEALYDLITPSDSSSPFTSADTPRILDQVWAASKARASRVQPAMQVRCIRDIVQGRGTISPAHPISFFPALLVVLNPLIVTVYRHAVAGKRILLYSPPPLLPVAAFAWCIQAMSVPPAAAGDASVSKWIGNVGLMDLEDVKVRKGGWIATTSDAIYKSHTRAYDLYVDLSAPSSTSLNPQSLASTARSDASQSQTAGSLPQGEATLYTPDPRSATTSPGSSNPSGEAVPTTYTFADVPLYRSLLLLQLSPASVTISSKLGVRGNMWLWAFELIERAWKLCRGVCEYALGQGNVGEVRLEEGEEDARLLGDEPGSPTPGLADNGEIEEADDDESVAENEREDEAVRVGRLLLRQFHHNTYHLHKQLRKVRKGTAGPLTETELKELCGKSWRLRNVGESIEGKWWSDLARTWGLVLEAED